MHHEDSSGQNPDMLFVSCGWDARHQHGRHQTSQALASWSFNFNLPKHPSP